MIDVMRLRRVCAVIVLAGAVGVVISRNPVHSALSLVATLFGVAVLFLEQDAQLLAAVQVIVYTGAIVVLILFVIMLLGVDQRRGSRRRSARRAAHRSPASRGLALLGLLLAAFVGVSTVRPHRGQPAGGLGHRCPAARDQRGPAGPTRSSPTWIFAVRDHRRPADHRRDRRGGHGPPARRLRAAARARVDERRDPRRRTRSRRDRRGHPAPDTRTSCWRHCSSPSARSGCSCGATRW